MDPHALWPDLGQIPALLGTCFFLATLGLAVERDVRTLTIPNRLVAALFLGWVLFVPLVGLTPRDIALGIGAAAMVFFGTVALHAMGWMGGGDSKLLTASALWLGAAQVVPFLLATMLAGGAIALLIVALRVLPVALPDRVARLAPQSATAPGRAQVPYALAIALGALTVLPRTIWLGVL